MPARFMHKPAPGAENLAPSCPRVGQRASDSPPARFRGETRPATGAARHTGPKGWCQAAQPIARADSGIALVEPKKPVFESAHEQNDDDFHR